MINWSIIDTKKTGFLIYKDEISRFFVFDSKNYNFSEEKFPRTFSATSTACEHAQANLWLHPDHQDQKLIHQRSRLTRQRR